MSLVDAARIVKNILDFMPSCARFTPVQFCSKIADLGCKHFRLVEIQVKDAFPLYVKSKAHLRKDSLNDIKYLGRKLIKLSPKFASFNFSELTNADCEEWLSLAFTTPSQFNKGRAFLHAFFEYAIRKNWCEKNPIHKIERKKVIEKEILPLTIPQVRSLIKTASAPKFKECLAAVALLTFAGIRPREVRRLTWHDIDLDENSITISSTNSKTGGTRQVEICPNLKRILSKQKQSLKSSGEKICPLNWTQKWKNIRDYSGFKGEWVQDVLRHTYASYHAKFYQDLPRLQLNMGHCNLNLLNSRYVNMRGVSLNYSKNFLTSFSQN